jgi:predicted lipid-binding transport protein (Tim44 family)
MKTTIARLCISVMLIFAPAFAQTVKQDMKDAGTDTKNAVKATGRATKHTAGKAEHKTKHAVHKASSKIANRTAGH